MRALEYEKCRRGLLIDEFGAVALWHRDVGPVDAEFAGFFGGDAVFGVLQAERVEERIRDVGEGGSAADADEVLASEFQHLGQEKADLVDFGYFAEFVSEFGEGIGRNDCFVAAGNRYYKR